MASRWAEETGESAEDIERRKREKQEKKRLKEEKLRKAQEPRNTLAPSDNIEGPAIVDGDLERPAKRRRMSIDPDVTEAQSAENNDNNRSVLTFPSRPFGPCRSVELYEFLNPIEEGSYGLVSRARLKSTAQVVALKRLKLENAHDGFPITGLREIQTLMACRHPNIVELREVVTGSGSEGPKDIYIVMEFHEHDLKTLLSAADDTSNSSSDNPFLPSEIKTLLHQLTSGLAYLHAHFILHRDLKTSNVLLNNRGDLRIADFGMARYTMTPPPSNLTQLVVTLWYRAPELLLGAKTYDAGIDMWSLGCVFAELLTQHPLFQGKNEVDQLSKIFGVLGPPNATSWPGFRNLPNAKALHPVLSAKPSSSHHHHHHPPAGISATRFPYLSTAGLALLGSLLGLNPADRPTAAEVLAHTYFREEPRPKPKEMLPTFPSKASQERRRRRDTPGAPVRGELPAVSFDQADVVGIFAANSRESGGAGFALRMG